MSANIAHYNDLNDAMLSSSQNGVVMVRPKEKLMPAIYSAGLHRGEQHRKESPLMIGRHGAARTLDEGMENNDRHRWSKD
ncbi:MAG: hypothetical protein EHM64_06975 [Ignavibacteriae bacterium]|nr:MAG: hypothetical protein EHM64_06975 [Ignavibacteriota bacterium]